MKFSSSIALSLLAGAATTVARTPDPIYPFDPNTTPHCTWWLNYEGAETCGAILEWFRITIEDFSRWNPSIGANCAGLVSGRSYCIEAFDEPETTTGGVTITTGIAGGTITAPPTTTTAPLGNGIETPTPTQSGMVTNCNKFATVRPTTTCQGILDWNKISLTDFVKWNPAVGANCENLWANTYACIGVINGSSSSSATTTAPPGNGIETPTPIQAGMVTNCNKFATVRPTTTCQGILDWNKISLADFVKWNPSVGVDCGNLWANTYACIGVIGGSSPPVTTTTPGNGITTPTPTQPGMVTNCNAFATVRPTTTCQGILDWNKISLADFVKWNPGVGPSCGNLWANTYACIGVIGGGPPPPPPATTTKPGNGIETPTPTQPGMVTNCNKFATVRPTTTCQGILDWNKISLADFVKWNPGVGASCGSLWSNTYACIGVIGGGGNGIETPSPIQAGMVTNCNKFAQVRPTTTCQGILDWNKITLANFYKWNPAVKADCTGLWANTWACIGVM